MIIKSIRHTQFLSNYSVNYIFDGMEKEPDKRWLIFQNLQNYERKGIIQEFNTNARYLTKTPNRKKCFRYHEVLAFAHENSQDLNREKLQRITNEYLKLRDPKGLSKAVCVPHLEKGSHYHVHILLTSNHIESRLSGDMMMTNSQYYTIRRQMERFVLREFPELHRSTVFLKEQEIQEILPPKYRSERRMMQLNNPEKKPSHQKEKMAEIVHQILHKSNSQEEFIELLKKVPQIEPFYRKGKLNGVIHERKKKYRLKTLGIGLFHENFLVLKRMQELKKINEKDRNISDSLER